LRRASKRRKVHDSLKELNELFSSGASTPFSHYTSFFSTEVIVDDDKKGNQNAYLRQH
jgi:hypothetical protein